MSLKQNPKIPECINYSQESPLKEFLLLVLGIGLSVVLLVGVLSYSVQFLVPYIPFQWEVKATSYFPLERALDNTKENSNEDSSSKDSSSEDNNKTWQQAQDAIQTLGNKLAKQAELAPKITLKFHLLNNEAANAFATLGGHIFITTGLLQTVQSENALAMVIAHEIAHIKHRHPIQVLSRGLIIQLVLLVLTGNESGTAIQSVLGHTSMITALSFNRDMESESDQEAIIILKKTYGHMGAVDAFFLHMLENKSQPQWAEIFFTHPDVEKRVEAIQKLSLPTTATLTPLDERLTLYLQGKILD
jgi:Zn-dependent protease with chaperone function